MMRKLIAAAAFVAFVTTAASATAQNPTSGAVAATSARYAEYRRVCTRPTTSAKLENEAAARLDAMTKAQFDTQIKGCMIALEQEKLLAGQQAARQRHAANVSPAAYIGAGAVVGAAVVRAASRNNNRNRNSRGGREYRSFDNVAEDSYRVTTKKGKEFDLRNVHAGSKQCLPPKQKHRSERCKSIPGGGINCEFDCY